MPARPKPDPEKHCRFCGARMYRKRYGGRMEDMAIFLRRSFCDMRCMAEAQIKGTVGRSAWLWRARKFRKDACEECGGTDKLHVHHVNHDWRDLAEDNLRTLCATCHLKGHWAEETAHVERRRTVKAESYERLLMVCEAILEAAPDAPYAAELEAALLSLRPGHH